MQLFNSPVNHIFRTTDLLSTELAEKVCAARTSKHSFSIWYDFTNSFDKWDIELIFNKIKDYAPEEVLIIETTVQTKRPLYNDIIEIRDALNTLATNLGTIGSGIQKYDYCGTKIFFALKA